MPTQSHINTWIAVEPQISVKNPTSGLQYHILSGSLIIEPSTGACPECYICSQLQHEQDLLQHRIISLPD